MTHHLSDRRLVIAISDLKGDFSSRNSVIRDLSSLRKIGRFTTVLPATVGDEKKTKLWTRATVMLSIID